MNGVTVRLFSLVWGFVATRFPRQDKLELLLAAYVRAPSNRPPDAKIISEWLSRAAVLCGGGRSSDLDELSNYVCQGSKELKGYRKRRQAVDLHLVGLVFGSTSKPPIAGRGRCFEVPATLESRPKHHLLQLELQHPLGNLTFAE